MNEINGTNGAGRSFGIAALRAFCLPSRSYLARAMSIPLRFNYLIRDPNGDTETGTGDVADILPIIEAAEITGASIVMVEIDAGK